MSTNMNDELSSLKASIVNLKSSIQVFMTHHGVVASTTADANLVYNDIKKLEQKINDLETLHEEYRYALSEYGNPTNWDIAYTEGCYFYRTLYPWVLAQESLKSLHEKKRIKLMSY